MNPVVQPPVLQLMRTLGEISCAKCHLTIQTHSIVIHDTDYQHIQCLDPLVLYHACPNGQFSQYVQGWKHLPPEDQRSTEEIFHNLLAKARYLLQHQYMTPQQQLLLAQHQKVGQNYNQPHLQNINSVYPNPQQAVYGNNTIAASGPSAKQSSSKSSKEKEKSSKKTTKEKEKEKVKKESGKSKTTTPATSSKSASTKSTKKATTTAANAKSRAKDNGSSSSKVTKKKRRAPSSSSESSSDSDSGSSSGQSSRKRDPNAPKRPQTGYMYFCIQRRPDLKAQHPDAKPKDLISMMGQLWRDLSDAEKKAYESKRADDVKRYEAQLKEYKETGRYHDTKGHLVDLKDTPRKVDKKKKKKPVAKKKVSKKHVSSSDDDSSDSDSDQRKRKPRKKQRVSSSSDSDSNSDSDSSDSDQGPAKKKKGKSSVSTNKKKATSGGSLKDKSRN
jgi:hypothetical protein